MSNNDRKATSEELLALYLGKATRALKKNNKHARKRNRLSKLQYQQSILNYEQLERQYLIEKAHLQPIFRLSVTELLVSGSDTLNDPELASEAKYLSDLGCEIDDRVLRFRVNVEGDAVYRRPSIVIARSDKHNGDERVNSMSELRYFAPLDSLDIDLATQSFEIYFLYRDKTTLPVIHKYRVKQQQASTLSRWDTTYLDTVFADTNQKMSSLNTSLECESLFSDRD
jgi:hypothetical protein